MLSPLSPKKAIDKIVREEWGRIFAALVKTLNNIQLAEDCLQDAIASAIVDWSENGLPRNPAAWLITVARRKAIDRLRRDQNFASKQPELSYLMDLENQAIDPNGNDTIPDKRLEMIFTCCHPALDEKARVALTLRTLGGLSTKEIASAFLDKTETMQQRLTRAKKKIAATAIPYEIPDRSQMPQRLSSVLQVIYLVFNEGYSATLSEALTQDELCEEAIRLARIVHQLLPDENEVAGLLAMMLLHDSRRQTRIGKNGEMIPLENQNRARWNRAKITEGVNLLKATLPKHRIGPYQLQGAISAVHAQSPSWAETDWSEISALYNVLHAIQPSAVVRINQAIAVSYNGSLSDALSLLDEASENGVLDHYQPYFAARADVLARAGERDSAQACFKRAIELSDNSRERIFLERKAARLTGLPH